MKFQELTDIPGIGKAIAKDLEMAGIKKPGDLNGADPEKLYEKSNKAAGFRQDRCLLYAFRCAVYCVSAKKPVKEKMKWWRWKDPRGRAKHE